MWPYFSKKMSDGDMHFQQLAVIKSLVKSINLILMHESNTCVETPVWALAGAVDESAYGT
jgi:hypothetical protein